MMRRADRMSDHDGCIDTHVHVFDPARFPYAANVIYRPIANETATAEQLIAVMDAHAVSHAVVVTPMAGYQSDNRVTLDAIRRYPDRLRGVAVVEADVSPSMLADLQRQGITGARVDLIGRGSGYLQAEGRRLPGLLRDQGLLLQIQCEGDQLAEVGDALADAGTVVIDHVGRPSVAAGVDQPGFRALLDLAARPDAIVKLSGPFRFSGVPHPHTDTTPYIARLLAAFGPGRCIWGSDWPFIRMDRRMDYGPTLTLLSQWVPDPADRRMILWDTPRRVFGFTRTG